MEFRTEPPGKKDEKGGGTGLESLVERYLDGLQKDPESQMAVLQMAEEQGIPPALISPMVDLDTQKIQEIQAARQAQQEQLEAQQEGQKDPAVERREMTPEPAEEPVEQELTPSDIADILESVIDYFDEETTLGELQKFVDENPEIIDTALDLDL